MHLEPGNFTGWGSEGVNQKRVNWLRVALTVKPNIHCLKQLRHRYRCCRLPVVTFVSYEFGTVNCATSYTKYPTFVHNIPETEKCFPSDLPWWYASFNQSAPCGNHALLQVLRESRFFFCFCVSLFMSTVLELNYASDHFQFPLPLGQPHSVFEGWPSVCCIFLRPNSGMAASTWDF